MKTQYYAATSLDGYIAAPGDDLGWLMQFGDGEPGEESSYPAFIKEVGALAMGSATYEWVLRHHVRPPTGEPKPWPYERPTWVFSRRDLPGVEGADLRFVRGDVRPVHRAMVEAAGGKNVWLVGGGELVGRFHDHGLLDELIIQVAPVTLGAGAPLLPRVIAKPPLRLTAVTSFGGTFAELRYEVPRGSGAAG